MADQKCTVLYVYGYGLWLTAVCIGENKVKQIKMQIICFLRLFLNATNKQVFKQRITSEFSDEILIMS